MTKEEAFYIAIGKKISQADQSQMFGKPCFKIKGKAFICFFQNEMVFKLTGDPHEEAISLDGSTLFDPSGKKRPMREWVQVSFDHKKEWEKFAKAASTYVSSK
jgi:hypothetical protein